MKSTTTTTNSDSTPTTARDRNLLGLRLVAALLGGCNSLGNPEGGATEPVGNVKKSIAAIVGLLLLSLGLASGEVRTWTDISGKFKIEAEFVALADGKVTLRSTTGKTKEIPLEKFSDADRIVAKELAAAGQAGEKDAAVKEQAGEIANEVRSKDAKRDEGRVVDAKETVGRGIKKPAPATLPEEDSTRNLITDHPLYVVFWIVMASFLIYWIIVGHRCPKCRKRWALLETGNYRGRWFRADLLEWKCVHCGFKKWRKEVDL